MTLEEKNTLEVGDRLYAHQYGAYSGPIIIDRVTNTQAFAGSYKFKREIRGTWIDQIGRGKWDSTSFGFETPEIIDKVRLRALKQKVSRFNFDRLSLDQLERIATILAEIPTA